MSGAFPARPGFLPALAGLGPLAGAEVALTGARGVLGSLVAGRLAAGGARVQAFAGDVTDGEAVARWLDGLAARHVFHFAARVPVAQVEADPLAAYEVNAIGTWNLCRALVRRGRPAWLFQCSTSHVYAPTAGQAVDESSPTLPATWYGTTKLAAERIVAEVLGKAGIPWCIGRVFSYTHALQRPPYLVPSLRERIAALPEGGVLELRNPSSVRDLLDGAHVAEAILLLARAGATGVVNIGSGAPSSVRDIALAVARAAGKAIEVRGEDAGAADVLLADVRRLRSLLGSPSA